VVDERVRAEVQKVFAAGSGVEARLLSGQSNQVPTGQPRDPSVRQALAPAGGPRCGYRCAIVLLRHLSKTAGVRSLYRGLRRSPSLRLPHRVADRPRPMLPDQFVLSQAKTISDRVPPSLAYRINAAADGVAQVSWLWRQATGPTPTWSP